MRWQRRIALLTGLVLTLSSCSVGDADTEAVPSEAAGVAAEQVFSPVWVPGLESCTKLPASQDGDAGGERLADLSLPCLTGGPAVNLSQLAGRPVLVNLWATWCGPCREEMPILEDAYKQYAGEVSFVGVDTQDNPEAAAAFLREVGVTYPQLVDKDGQLLDHLGIPGLPVTVVLDDRGRVATRHVGPLTHETLRDLVDGVAAN